VPLNLESQQEKAKKKPNGKKGDEIYRRYEK